MIIANRLLKLSSLHILLKQRESIASQKLRSQDFWQIASSVLNKGNSAAVTLFNGLEVLSYASNNAKLFTKAFSNNSDVEDSRAFPSRSNLKLHNIYINPRMVKKVIMYLDSSKVSGPDCIPVVVLKNSSTCV